MLFKRPFQAVVGTNYDELLAANQTDTTFAMPCNLARIGLGSYLARHGPSPDC